VQQAISLLPYVPTILIKLGAHGVLSVRLLPKDVAHAQHERTCAMRSEGDYVDVLVSYHLGLQHEGIVSVTGAGYRQFSVFLLMGILGIPLLESLLQG